MTRERRRQRQRDTIVSAAAGGDLARATALLAEHAAEFPQDGGLLGAFDPADEDASSDH